MTVAVVELLGSACSVSGTDATVLHDVLGATLALRMFLSSIVLTARSRVVDAAA